MGKFRRSWQIPSKWWIFHYTIDTCFTKNGKNTVSNYSYGA